MVFPLFARSVEKAPSGTMASAFAFHPPSRRVVEIMTYFYINHAVEVLDA